MNSEAAKQETSVHQASLLVRATQAALISFGLLVAAVIAAVLMYIWRSPPEPVLPDSSVMTLNAYEGYGTTIVQDLSISQRPLFWQERRPLPEEEVVVATEPVVKENRNVDDFKLIALFSASNNPSVVVMYKDNKHRLRVNDELDGWTLVAVKDNSALFQGGGSQGVESKVLYEPVTFPKQWSGGDSLLNNQPDF